VSGKNSHVFFGLIFLPGCVIKKYMIIIGFLYIFGDFSETIFRGAA